MSNEANVAAVGKSCATSSEKQGPDKILKDFGLIRLSTSWDKNKDDEISMPFDAIIISVSYTHLTLPTNREV